MSSSLEMCGSKSEVGVTFGDDDIQIGFVFTFHQEDRSKMHVKMLSCMPPIAE